MFRVRLVSGICLVLIALGLLITGGNVLLAALAVISLIGLFELYRVFKIEKTALGMIGYAAVILLYLNIYFQVITDISLFIVMLLLADMLVYVFTFPKYHANQVLAAFFCVFYAGLMISYVYHMRVLDHGVYLVWLIFLSSWGCDTCAYCVGMLFGKHKMAPVLSPKKSVEGAFGGVIGASILTFLYGMAIRNYAGLNMDTIFLMVVICAVGALVSMVGDLAASAIKRNYEIKDYGKLIPGHGGIMDRFDSVFFTAPFIYALSVILL